MISKGLSGPSGGEVTGNEAKDAEKDGRSGVDVNTEI
jgi:hypothetical protein